jgi:hypothetical protein
MLIHTLYSLLQHLLSLLGLPCLHQSLPADGSQQCPLLPRSRSYRAPTVYSQLSVAAKCPRLKHLGMSHTVNAVPLLRSRLLAEPIIAVSNCFSGIVSL